MWKTGLLVRSAALKPYIERSKLEDEPFLDY